MGITQKNEYEIGVNNDLSNMALNVDLNRIGADLTYLENDGGTLKVSVGSIIESQGSIYVVDTAAETPTGTAQDGAYLFFDDGTPGFVWSNTPGTYDPERGGIYDGSDRRQCRFRLRSSTTWDQLVTPEASDIAFDGNVRIDGDVEINTDLLVTGDSVFSGSIEHNELPSYTWLQYSIGDWDMDSTSNVDITHGLSADRIMGARVLIRADSDAIVPLLGYNDISLRDTTAGGLLVTIGTTTIRLQRIAGGSFESVDYNDGSSYNRGFVWVQYADTSLWS